MNTLAKTYNIMSWQKSQAKCVPENIGNRVARGRERKHIEACMSIGCLVHHVDGRPLLSFSPNNTHDKINTDSIFNLSQTSKESNLNNNVIIIKHEY